MKSLINILKAKHKIVVLSVCLFCWSLVFFSCSNDEIPVELKNAFVQLFGGSSYNEGSKVKLLKDGSYIIMGTTTTGNGKDIYLAGIDQNGKNIWKKIFGGTSDEIGYNMEILSDGKVLIVGSELVNGFTNVLLIETDAKAGGERDSISIPDYQNNQNKFNLIGLSVKELEDKSWVIVGSASNIADGSRGLIIYLTPDDFKNKSIPKNANSLHGNFVINDVAQCNSGCIVTGYETNFAGIAYTNKGAEDIVSGIFPNTHPDQMISFEDYGNTGTDKGVRVLRIGDSSYVSLSTYTNIEKNTGKDVMVTWYDYKTQTDSIKINRREFYNSGTNNDDEAGDIVATDNGFMITGTTTRGANTNIFVLAINKDGITQYFNPIIVTANQRGKGIEATPDGGCVIIGGSGSTATSKIVLYKLDKNGKY